VINHPVFGRIALHSDDELRELAPWSGRDVVELGCGTGFWLPRYARTASVGA
jgi:hypothetical protein